MESDATFMNSRSNTDPWSKPEISQQNMKVRYDFDGLGQDWSNSSALVMDEVTANLHCAIDVDYQDQKWTNSRSFWCFIYEFIS